MLRVPATSPERPEVPRDRVHELLTSLPAAVVLRNHDIWKNFARGGDLDMGVADLDAAEAHLLSVLGPPLLIARRSLVRSYVYKWGKIDLLGPIEWRGAVFLSHEDLTRDSCTSELGYPKPRLAHEAMMSWFLSLLWGGFFKARYSPVIVQAAQQDSSELHRLLQQAFGRRWAARLLDAAKRGLPEVSTAWAASLRRALRWRALARAPLQTIERWGAFWLREVGLRLRPPIPWVAVLGPDGVGKTTLLQSLTETWPAYLGEVRVHHWRPHFIDGWRNGSASVVENPHGMKPRGAVASTVKLAWLWIDWFCGYWLHLCQERARQRLVIFDRHFLDLLVDPQRYRYGGPMWLASAVGRLVPRPDVVIILDAPTDVIRSRKDEVSRSETVRQRKEYRELSRQVTDGAVIDTNRPLQQVAADFQDCILNYMARSVRDKLQAVDGLQPPRGRLAADPHRPSMPYDRSRP